MSGKKMAAAVLAAIMLAPNICGAETINIPFGNNAEARAKAAEILAQDPEFINMLVLNVFQAKLQAGRQPRDARNLIEGGIQGMQSANENLPDAAPKKNAEMIGGGAQNMSASDGMGAKNGMIAEKPAGKFAAPEGEQKASPAVPVDPSVENVDFFLSLTCAHCANFWKTLNGDEILKQHLLDPKINIRIIPNSTNEAGLIIVFESLHEKDPVKARDFLTWYFDDARHYGNGQALFQAVEKWLADNGMPGLKSIHDDKDLIKRIGERVEKNIALDTELEASYPSVFINGKNDREYFSKVREAALKKMGDEKGAEKGGK